MIFAEIWLISSSIFGIVAFLLMHASFSFQESSAIAEILPISSSLFGIVAFLLLHASFRFQESSAIFTDLSFLIVMTAGGTKLWTYLLFQDVHFQSTRFVLLYVFCETDRYQSPFFMCWFGIFFQLDVYCWVFYCVFFFKQS